ncbi:glutamate receptor-interacting protein 1 [Agrilus planipennis]|uniref:Glutamate receptor-interacting protein 1 n=1 Tax=Agrilus planipennis TaxID=224129 RepID=A0A7F5RHX5_AGRPL|nr:glutamate receptor-interacting protein 1 [Agrilus planipennis]
MKLWKVLARNSHVYTSHVKQKNGMELYEFKSRSPTCSEDSGKRSEDSSLHDSFHQQSFFTTVQLKKRPGEALGITVTSAGNSEMEMCPSIVSLRPGSVALTSDQLVPGDRIHSVNGINTSRMRPEEVLTLLENIDGNASLDIEYTLPHYASQNSLCVMSKVTEVAVERIDGSLGLTLRGGANHEQPHLSRPFVVTHIRPHGSAQRTGLIRVGDRLLKVDNQSLSNKTLMEAQQILKDPSPNKILPSVTTLTIEYDVNIMETVKYANSPLLVEIEPSDNDLGLVLTNYCDFEPDEILSAGFFIDQIIPGSTSDRCGALNVGDQLLAIDDICLDDWNGSPRDAEKLLRGATKLQILPAHAVQRSSSRNFKSGVYQSSPSVSGFSTINSRRSRSRNNRYNNRKSSVPKLFEGGDQVNTFCTSPGTRGVCHSETLYTTLVADRGKGYGLTLAVGEHSDNRPMDILIGRIANDSSAYRCGCLQTGDRIISVNHQPNLTLQEINNLLEAGTDPNNTPKIIVQVEFDVADTIVPSSGIFTVKLPKKGPGLGITITASKNHPDEPFIISEIRRGSIAHRTGTLHAGDRLLSIDNRSLDNVNFESNFDIFQWSTNDIVTLKIEKTETDNANLFLDCIVYTVELTRYGGPLGITISGSEDSQEPIILSRLTEGGLAEKTGALHVGDRILAINSESLEHRPLSEAIRLLQTSGDRVQLKIARHLNPKIDHVENKDIESVISEPLSLQEHPENKESQNKNECGQLQYYSDTEETFCPSPLPLPNYNFGNTLKYEANMYCQSKSNNFMERLPGTYSNENILGHEIHHVTLFKDSIYDDYGFSVSDGLYEKGVYINRIRKGGPADIVGLLKPYDRILQVNDTCTQDFDCCLTVPLIASAGDRIELVVSRNPYLNRSEKDIHLFSWSSDDQDNLSNRKMLSISQNTITKTL